MGINLVVIPFHDWKKCEREGFRTRDAHFMQEFSKQSDVEKILVVNRPISIAEIILLRRNWKVKRGEMIWKKRGFYLTKANHNIFVLDIVIWEVLKPIFMKRNWTSYVFGKQKIVDAVHFSLNFLSMLEEYSVFISAPLFAPLIKKLKPKVFAFDAQDNLLKHEMYKSVNLLKENYEYCLAEADLVYTNSKETAEWFKVKRFDALHISNGVDPDMFDGKKAYSVPLDMEEIKSPIVGYAGKMQEMFDVDLMETCVKTFPEARFVFVGQELNPKWTEKLWRYPNTHYLGDKYYQNLPQYLASFDICVVPISKTRQHGVDPIKFYEYLSMNKPIVTTNLDGTTMFQDYPQVKIARNQDEFVEGLQFFIEKINNHQEIEIRELPRYCTWKSKSEKIINDIKLKMVT